MFTIESEKVQKTMEKVLEVSNAARYKKELVEHFVYILFKHLKIGYNSYSADSKNLYVLQSFMNFNKIESQNIKSYDFDELIVNFIDNKDNIQSVEDFMKFLNQYFVFFHKTQKSEMNKFIDEYLAFASMLDGSERPTLAQSPLVPSEVRIQKIKKSILSVLNEDDDIKFTDITFHKNGKDRGVIANFDYLYSVDDNFLQNYITSVNKMNLILHDLELNYSRVICDKNWNPKRILRTRIVGTNPSAKYLLVLNNELFPYRHGKNVKGEHIGIYHRDQLKVNELGCRLFDERTDTKEYENKIMISSQLHFSFEEYFDFLIERFNVKS